MDSFTLEEYLKNTNITTEDLNNANITTTLHKFHVCDLSEIESEFLG